MPTPCWRSRFRRFPGVAQVLVYGAQKFAVRVQVDPEAAAARGLSLDDVRSAVAKANSSVPVGTLTGPRQNVTLQASGQLEKAADYRSVVVAWRNGAPVKLDEIARVIDSVENDKIASWFNGERSIVLGIQRQPDANTVEVVDFIRAKLPSLRAQVPASIQLETLMDRSVSVRQAVFDVQETLLIAIALVIMVIFLFLRSVSATAIPALAVPISLVGTCAAMYAFGFSINNMTLLALTLSVGFVVDDAIVMLENIVRHIEGGMRPFEAALKGAREIGFTIISITFSLIAVFIPVLLMGGVVGRVFREFAVTISVAIIVSGFVSLTLTPMLCARMLRGHREGERAEHRAARVRGDVQRLAAGLRMGARQGDCLQGGDAGDHLRHHHRHGLALHRRSRRASSRARIPGFIAGHHRGGDRHVIPGDGRAPAPGRRDHSRRTRRSITSIPRSASAVPTRPPTTGACSSCSSRKSEREPARVVMQRLRADGQRRARDADRSSRASRTSISAAASPRASTSTRCRAAIPRRSIGSRPRCATRSAKLDGTA